MPTTSQAEKDINIILLFDSLDKNKKNMKEVFRKINNKCKKNNTLVPIVQHYIKSFENERSQCEKEADALRMLINYLRKINIEHEEKNTKYLPLFENHRKNEENRINEEIVSKYAEIEDLDSLLTTSDYSN